MQIMGTSITCTVRKEGLSSLNSLLAEEVGNNAMRNANDKCLDHLRCKKGGTVNI